MMKSKMLLLLAIASVSLTFGCNKKESNNSTSISQRSARGNGNSAQMAAQGMYYQATAGKLYADPQYAQAFSEAVRGLAAASMDYQYIGNVPTNGAILRGYVEVNSAGQLVPGRSVISIEIQDSFSGTVDEEGHTIPPIYVNVPATQGTAYNGQVNLTFSDQYGTITMQGQYYGAQFSGTLSYQNTNGHSGTIAFQTTTCGFFRCQ